MLTEYPERGRPPTSWSRRTVLRRFDLAFDLYLLVYLLGVPGPRFDLPYCAKRLVMQEVQVADERREIAEYVADMQRLGESTVELPEPGRSAGACEPFE